LARWAPLALQVFTLVRRLRDRLGVNDLRRTSTSARLPNRHGINNAFCRWRWRQA
jgi:hypothetical protein